MGTNIITEIEVLDNFQTIELFNQKYLQTLFSHEEFINHSKAKLGPDSGVSADDVSLGQKPTKPQLVQPDSTFFLKDAFDYNLQVEEIREREFKRFYSQSYNINKNIARQIYLDNAANTQYPEGLVDAISADYKANLYSNPHSHSPSAMHTKKKVDLVRTKVLGWFQADPEEYTVIFTQNATQAIRLVSENFPWKKTGNHASHFFCTHNSHTSIIGMRNHALSSGGIYEPIQLEEGDDSILKAYDFCNNLIKAKNNGLKKTESELLFDKKNPNYHLFAYPGQCNFTGQKYHYKIQFDTKNELGPSDRILVLLDGASLSSTSPISLSTETLNQSNPSDKTTTELTPDFMSISFYKIFGLPTGLGALIARKEALSILSYQKQYFGGGTMSSISFKEPREIPHDDLVKRFEDGTINYLDIIGLGIAMEYHKNLYGPMLKIQRHTACLTRYLYSRLNKLKHFNGIKLIRFYPKRPENFSSHHWGPTVSFNFINSDGSFIGSASAQRLLAAAGFHIRSGTFCNPGGLALSLASAVPDSLGEKIGVHRCGEEQDLDDKGNPLGALRVSLGAFNTWGDIDQLLKFLINGFLVPPPTKSIYFKSNNEINLKSIAIYPIKSCGGFIVKETCWDLVPGGLKFDRVWMLVVSDGKGGHVALNQKKIPEMALIKPTLKNNSLVLSATGSPSLLTIPLDIPEKTSELHVRMANRTVKVHGYLETQIDAWFSNFLNRVCRLVRLDENLDTTNSRKAAPCHLSNEAPFLLLSSSSLNDLASKISSPFSRSIDGPGGIACAFRSNFILEGKELRPYIEDDTLAIRIGDQYFKVLGRCRRCHMVNICQDTAVILPEPYLTLSKHRSEKNKLYFGVHLIHVPSHSTTPFKLSTASEIELINDPKIFEI